MKHYILCTLILISSISLGQNLKKNWMFESIHLANDSKKENLKPIAEGDYMLLREDGTFIYELSTIPLLAEGD